MLMKLTPAVYVHKPCMLCVKNKVKPAYNDTLGTQNLWPLLSGGRCPEVTLCYKAQNWDSIMLAVIRRWSLTQV